MTNHIDKPFWQSKKFIAFLLMQLILAGLAVLALITQDALGWPLSAFMLALVLTMGAVAFGFIGKQADLDHYLRGMALNRVQVAPKNEENENGDVENDEPEI